MKILILGSNSFSGITFAKFLLEKNYKVFGVSQSKFPPSKFNPIYQSSKKKNFKFYKLDINRSFKKLCNIIKKNKVDIIVDFAGQGMVAESWDYPALTFQTNLISKINLYKFIEKQKNIKKYIKISTPEVYGNAKGVLTEKSSHNPSTPYALSHSTVDFYLNMLCRQKKIPVIFGRFANFYGPYQRLYRIIPIAIHKALNKQKIDLHGGGTSRRSFIFSDDFNRAILSLIKKGKIGEVYHFAPDEYLSIKELVLMIYNKFKLTPEKFINISKDRIGKDKDYKMSNFKSKKQLNFKYKTSLSSGVDETIKWYKKYKYQFTQTDEKFRIK